MAGNRKLTVEILGDAKNVTGAFDQAEKSAGRLSASFSALNVAGGVALANLGGKAVAFGKQSIDAASDMNETLGAMNQIFNTRAEMSAVSAKKVMEDQKNLTTAQERYAEAVSAAEGKVGKERDKAVAKAEEWKLKVDKAQKDVAENERLNSEAHAKFLKEGTQLSDQYGKSIEDFAGKAAAAYGQSKQQAIDAANEFATFGKAAGQQGEELVKFSTGLTGLASDLASFKNTSPQDAINALGAALRGENEPMRRYGVLLDEAAIKNEALRMGLYNGKGELDANAKIMATYHAVLSQTKDAQGDFARTSESMANQQRIQAAEAANLKVTLGSALLPLMKELTGIATSLASSLAPLATELVEHLGPALEYAAKWISGLVGAFKEGGLGGLIDKLREDLEKAWPVIRDGLSDAWGKATAWLKEHGPEILRGIGDALLKLGDWIRTDVVPAVVDKLGDLVQAIGKWGKDHGPDILRQLGEWTAQFGKWVRDDVAPAIGDALGKAIPALGKFIKDSAPKIADQLIEWTDQFLHWAGRLAGEIGKWIVDHRGEIFDWIKDTASTIGAQLGEWSWQFLKWLGALNLELGKKALELNLKLFAWIGEAAVHIGGQLLSWTAEFAKWLVIDLPLDLAKKAGGAAVGALGWIGDMAGEIPSHLAKWTGKFGEWLVGLPKDLAGSFAGLVESLAGSIFDAFKSMWDKAAGVINHSKATPGFDPIPTFGGGSSSGSGVGDAVAQFVDDRGKLEKWLKIDPDELGKQIDAAIEELNKRSPGSGNAISAFRVMVDRQGLGDELDAGLRLLKPIVKLTPTVEQADIEAIGREISNGLKGKIGAGATNLFANEDIIAGAREAAKKAVEDVNANPPAAIKPPVDQDNTTAEVATKTKTAVETVNTTPPAALKPPVDSDHVLNKAAEAFAGAVATINAAPAAPALKPNTDGDHVAADMQGKAAAAVATTTATLPPVVISVAVDQAAFSAAKTALEGLAGLAATTNAAVGAAAGQVPSAGAFLGNGNSSGSMKPATTEGYKLGDRQGQWVLTTRGWEVWNGTGAAGVSEDFIASVIAAGGIPQNVGSMTSTAGFSRITSTAGAAADVVSRSIIVRSDTSSGSSAAPVLIRSSPFTDPFAGQPTLTTGTRESTTPFVIGSSAGADGVRSSDFVASAASSGSTVVGSGGTVIQIGNLIGELSVTGDMTNEQARRLALNLMDALEEVAVSRGRVTVDGAWRLGS